MKYRGLVCLVALAAILPAACRSSSDEEPEESARPVSVFTLSESNPNLADQLTGSVESWKTEDIGFEVAGRVEFVVEPETDVVGRAYRVNGDPITSGTLLAKLDEARYQFNVTSAQAEIETARRHREAIVIHITKVIPAQIQAEHAERRLAKTEVDRLTPLVPARAVAEAELDRVQAKLDASIANIAQLTATLAEKEAEVAATDAKIRQLQQQLADAERDVEDCGLYTSYTGQVAQVHALPGAFVERGQPVVTVQMMDPIKVEFEVSAEMARRMRHGDRLAIFTTESDGSKSKMVGFIYMIDPLADPATRTFTVALMIRNRKIETPVPADLAGKPLPRTDGTWKILGGILGRDDLTFTLSGAIHEDAHGAYVWKILNRDAETLGQANPVLNVEKVRVQAGELQVPLLGLFTLREVTIIGGEDFDPSTDLVAGELTLPPDVPEPWTGDAILLDRPRWLLRPGDLVGVELGGESKTGFYVPLNSLNVNQENKSIFAVSDDGGKERLRQIQVRTFQTVGKLVRVESTGDEPLKSGMRLVAGQAHYLSDGETVVVVESVEVRP
jgi:multidrug efflux pump subunit AcrA (membrane-fusion protein)